MPLNSVVDPMFLTNASLSEVAASKAKKAKRLPGHMEAVLGVAWCKVISQPGMQTCLGCGANLYA